MYAFHEAPDWSTELRERHRLMLDIIRLARQLGVEFAFPTQTLHLVQEAGAAAPPGLSDQREISQALMRGRSKARDIVAAHGLGGERPPPVRFDVPLEENRGEDGDGG